VRKEAREREREREKRERERKTIRKGTHKRDTGREEERKKWERTSFLRKKSFTQCTFYRVTGRR